MASDDSTSSRYEDVILRREFQTWLACERPKAWAQYRDGIVKNLPWYYDVEAGVCLSAVGLNHHLYSPIRYITGLLIGSWPALNSYIDAEVIITSVHNVKSELNKTDIARCAALENTHRDKRLVGCLIERGATTKNQTSGQSKLTKNQKWSHATGQPFFSCPMPTNQDCWVLGFYIVTDFWKAFTKEGPVTMARLERWKLEEKAWFASSDPSHDPPPLSARDFDTRAPREICQTCQTSSPRMYEEHFLCRNGDCEDHWKINGNVVDTELTYMKTYLQQREPRSPDGFKPYVGYKSATDFPEIAPNALERWQQNYKAYVDIPMTQNDFHARMKALNKGFWCPHCGMLNRRLKWNKWECANITCNFTLVGQPYLMTAAQLTAIGKTTEPQWSKMKCFVKQEETGDHIRYDFDLHHGCGVTVIIPKADTNTQPQGSDWLLDRFQRLANTGQIDLQKQFVKAKKSGTTSNHFIHNYGHPYNLDIDIKQQTSFEDAPRELSIARDVANSLCRQYQSRPGAEDFNECYVAGYFTDNQMNYHSDGEKGLGSVIATWTLGGEGKMLIAPKPTQYFGRRTNNKCMDEEDLLLPGVVARKERRELKEELDAKLAANSDDEEECNDARKEYREKLEELMKKQAVRGAKAKPAALLELPLTHGSIVVMYGDKMQKYYQHEVSVKTPLRFALTFRNVTEENALQKTLKRAGEHSHTPDESYLEKFHGDTEGTEETEEIEEAEETEDEGERAGKKRRRLA